jgi:hypothetical protein
MHMPNRLVLLVCALVVGVTLACAQQNGNGPGANNGNGNAFANGIANGNAAPASTGSLAAAAPPAVQPLSNAKTSTDVYTVTGLYVDFVKDEGEELVYPTLILNVAGEDMAFKAAPYQYVVAMVDITQWVPGETEITVQYVVNAKGENLILTLAVNDSVITLRDGTGHPAWKNWPFAEDSSGQFHPQVDLATLQAVSGIVKSISKGLASGKVRLHVVAGGKAVMITVGTGMLLTLQGMEVHTGDRIQAMIAQHVRTREWVLLQIRNPETGESVTVRNRFGHQVQLNGPNN